MKLPKLVLKFETPTQGYWDGGAKSGGTFTPEVVSTSFYTKANKNITRRIYKDREGYVRWGSWELNFWFTCKFGKSWKHAAAIAKRKLKHNSKKPCTITVE
jgi:hypothetical protein